MDIDVAAGADRRLTARNDAFLETAELDSPTEREGLTCGIDKNPNASIVVIESVSVASNAGAPTNILSFKNVAGNIHAPRDGLVRIRDQNNSL